MGGRGVYAGQKNGGWAGGEVRDIYKVIGDGGGGWEASQREAGGGERLQSKGRGCPYDIGGREKARWELRYEAGDEGRKRKWFFYAGREWENR